MTKYKVFFVPLVVSLCIADTVHFPGAETWTKWHNCSTEQLENFIPFCNRPAQIHLSELQCTYVHKKWNPLMFFKLEYVTMDPLILLVRHLLTPLEIQSIIESAKKKGTDKGIVMSPAYGKRIISPVRKANDAYLSMEDTKDLRVKVDELLGKNAAIEKDTLVVLYPKGGYFSPHWDLVFNEAAESHRKYARLCHGFTKDQSQLHNRLASFMISLKAPTIGGHTVFPRLNMSVHMEEGDGILWMNLDEFGDIIPAALHGGCPVTEGEKIAAVLYVKELGVNFGSLEANQCRA